MAITPRSSDPNAHTDALTMKPEYAHNKPFLRLGGNKMTGNFPLTIAMGMGSVPVPGGSDDLFYVSVSWIPS